MGLNKQYKGYKAYDYLDKSEFHKLSQFDLVDDDQPRVEEYFIELTDEDEKRAKRIMEDNIIISLHEHSSLYTKDMNNNLASKQSGRQAMAYGQLSRSCLDAVFDNMMNGSTIITSHAGWKFSDIIHDLGTKSCDVAQQDFIIKCATVKDIYTAHKEGKIAWVPCIEGAAPIENELDRIDILYGLGIRLMGITYSESNGLGSGLKESRDGGLTSFGKKAVQRMNKVGMAIDVSHCGPITALDVIETSEKPIIMSHVGCRSLWDIKRLSPDEVFIACANKGGIIGVEAAPHTTMTHTHKTHNIDSFMEHFVYLVNLVGIDHVGFGPDTLYGDHVALHHVSSKFLSTNETKTGPEYTPVEYVKGIENPTESSINIVRWLVKNQYSDEDIAKVIGQNALRVLKQIWS